MSLIYSAIRSLEDKPALAGGEPVVPAVAPSVRQAAPKRVLTLPVRWLYLAGMGSVLAAFIGGVAFGVAREGAGDRSGETSSATAAVDEPAVIAPPQAVKKLPTELPTPVATSVPPEPVPEPEPVPAAPVARVVQAASPPVVPETTIIVPPTTRALPQAIANDLPVVRAAAPVQLAVKVDASADSTTDSTAEVTVHRETLPRAAKAAKLNAKPVDETEDVNRLVSAARQAIDAGNRDAADATLRQLAARLPPESITLLRLRAWQAQSGNEEQRAIALYGEIVDRLPDDESASINLAVLHWKAGRHDEARRIIAVLAGHHPESDTVRRYVVQFGERP